MKCNSLTCNLTPYVPFLNNQFQDCVLQKKVFKSRILNQTCRRWNHCASVGFLVCGLVTCLIFVGTNCFNKRGNVKILPSFSGDGVTQVGGDSLLYGDRLLYDQICLNLNTENRRQSSVRYTHFEQEGECYHPAVTTQIILQRLNEKIQVNDNNRWWKTSVKLRCLERFLCRTLSLPQS